MRAKQYKIYIQTPIGKKQGMINISTNGGVLTGNLDVLGHSEPFDGEIDADGKCLIKGKIITLLRTVHYTAEGTFSENDVHLRVEAANNTFEVTGEATQ